MKNSVRKPIMLLLAIVFLFGVGMSVRQMLDSRNAAQSNSHAQSIAGHTTQPATTAPSTEAAPTETVPAETVPDETTQPTLPPDENAQFLESLDIPALQEINPEVIGWIYIPGTEIDYPLLHTQDNETYLHTAWDGTSNVAGSIFLETKCSPDFTAFNTIVYGHNMRNGSMFAALKNYQDHTYYLEHPCIYIVTNTQIYRYEIFSAYEASVVSDTYRLSFKSDTQKQTALQYYLESSVLDLELSPTEDDFILTLSTCTGTGTYETRWVVQAMCTGEWDK